MARFVIHGRRPLKGEIKPVGNKNAVLPMLAASLLTEEPLTLRNVPHIEDVAVMLELLADLGVQVQRRGRTVRLCAAGIRKRKLNAALCRRVRSSILLAGPLAARHGEAVLYPPGGDIIGKRRLDTHFEGLRALGISVTIGDAYRCRKRKLRAADLILDEASVTATENLLMAATLAEGTTTIFNAACEPHVTDLGNLLVKMGARIEGLGTNLLRVDGVSRLRGARHAVNYDYIEVGSFLAAAAVTRGDITVQGITDASTMQVIRRPFRRLGVHWESKPDRLIQKPRQRIRIQRDWGSAPPKIEDGVWPSFPSDLMSVAIVVATQASGTILFFEKMFESRMYFVDHLLSMGAHIVQCDPHRVLVTGPAALHGSHLTSPDIRAGMALIIAALCAKGCSVIENAHVIDRGYEAIDRRLRALGAQIERET